MQMLAILAQWPPTATSVLSHLASILRHQISHIGERRIKPMSTIARSPDDAQVVVAANVLNCVGKFLDSPNTELRVLTCELLAHLVRHESTRDAVLRVKPCRQLISLLRDQNPAVIQRAARSLARIATSVNRAQAVVEGKMLDCVEELLEFPNTTTVAVWTCKILGELARHETIVAAILAVKPCEQLVSLLGVTNYFPVRTTAIFALVQLSKTPDGAAAIAATDFFVHLSHLMEFTDREVLLQTCVILRNLSKDIHGRPSTH
ncbi:armadillo-type protein [Mycena latifolia]|nr:armadillo-type protein [Mycena latifolia]